ncbi:response regulator [Streptomyces sp. NPDC021093]|uniref:response regulator n=1 Tax=Streptomyces sp. NPDC021093 TaxID=3365112 RepID=UPI003789695D
MSEARYESTSYHSGPRSASTHVSQHTSSHTVEPRSEHTPHGTTVPPLPPEAAFPTHFPIPDSPDPFGPLPVLRVVIVDDNPVVRAGLTALLGSRADIDVVAEANDGRQALAAAEHFRPDVVLLDVRMPGVDGLSALPHLVKVAPVMMLTYSRESEIVQEALRLGAGGYVVHGEFTPDQLLCAVRDIKEGRAHFTASAQNALLAHMRGNTGATKLPEGLGLGSVYATGVPYAGRSATAHTWEDPNSKPDVSSSSHRGASPSHLQPGVPQYPLEYERQAYGLSAREVEVMDLIAAGMSNQQIAATCFISEKTVKNHINRIFAKLHSATRSEAIAKWVGTARNGRRGIGGGGNSRG